MNITIISDSNYSSMRSCANIMAKAFKGRGHEVKVILPFYDNHYTDNTKHFGIAGSTCIRLPQGNFNINLYSTEKDGVEYYLISNKLLYGRDKQWGYRDDSLRSTVLCMSALEIISQKFPKTEYIITDTPNTALISVFLKFKHPFNSRFKNVKTYHYINSQEYGIYESSCITSVFGLSPEEKHLLISNDRANLTKAAIIASSRVFVGENAVDLLYNHHNELHHTIIQFGFKIRKLRLGIDYTDFSPENDTDIHKNYSSDDLNSKFENKLFIQKYLYLDPNADIPLITLYPDGNTDIWHRYINELNRCDIQTIVISNRSRYNDIHNISKKCICISNRSAETLKNIFSASDFCIFGGLGSECGNPSFISAAYGCIPIIPSHRFFDYGFTYFNKLTLDGNGYTFDPNIRTDMMYTLWDALGLYRHDKRAFNKLSNNTMKKIFSAIDSIEPVEKEAEKTLYSFI